ncbi:MAG: sel1 repeat family protein [Akkermansiaceae bacterium]|nr:sel1 repeat family protein [Akkermansiaceae bacterium]
MNSPYLTRLLLAGTALFTACNTPQILAHKADNGDPIAQYRFAVMILDTPSATLQNKQRAIAHLKNSTEAGNRNAPALLARCYITGNGTSTNLKEAVKYLKIASDRDNFRAQLLLAHFYANGLGTPPCPLKSVDEIRYAAMQGSPQAAELMFLCFYDGFGVPRNTDLALGWLENAAEYGSEPAQLLLTLAKNDKNAPNFDENVNLLKKKLDFFPKNR